MSEVAVTGWQPLLDGDEAAQAWRAIDAIAKALAAPLFDGAADASLNTGAAGRALFYAYLNRARPDAEVAARSRTLLDGAIDGIGELSALPALYSGFCGVAWTVDHLLPSGEDDPNSELDELLLELVDGWEGPYDLVSGLCGFGVYALGRAHRPSGRAILARVVEKLEASATPAPDGLRWLTRPEWMSPWARERFPGGYHNLGLAHGAPAIALVLAGAAHVLDGDAADRARAAYAGALQFILTPRLPPESASFLSECDEDRVATRAAWCYGDPGAAAALFAAARALGDATRERDALSLALRAAARADDGGVRDAGLCHGAAGLALIFQQLHHATGDARFADAARRWYRDTLARRSDDARGGFFAWTPGDDGGGRLDDDASLITGLVGVGLALLAAVTPVAPRWSTVMGLALPPDARDDQSRR